MNTSQSNRWSVIKSPWFYIAVILFVLHQVLQLGLEIKISFLDNYLDPFLFLPIALGAYLQERRLFLKNDGFKFDHFKLIALSVLLCVIVEVFFPFFNAGYSFDIYDFIAYYAGAIYFNYKINRKFIVES
jgi:hypothetical protein